MAEVMEIMAVEKNTVSILDSAALYPSHKEFL